MIHERKISLVHVAQYLEIGGLESFIIEFCRKIDRRKFNVAVLCLNGYDEQYKRMLEEINVPLYLITKKSKFDFSFFLKAASLLREHNVDILNAHGGCFFYTAIIGCLARVKGIFFTAHGQPIRAGLQERIEELVSCILSDRIIAVSDEIATDMKKRIVMSSNKIATIINGINTEKFALCSDNSRLNELKNRFNLPLEKIIVGTVGRLESVKNYGMLISAFARLIDLNKDVHLVFVGSGNEEENLKNRVNDLGLSEHVTFMGMQYDLPLIYPLFKIFVLSSLTEGTSLSLLEAQSCGVPAVVTKVGGNSGVIQHGVNGYLCDLNDTDSMVLMIDKIIDDELNYVKMSEASRENVCRKFSLDIMLQKYIEIYEDVVNTGTTRDNRSTAANFR
jgi:glycosyltransferase involved in cell wall biosynthesis